MPSVVQRKHTRSRAAINPQTGVRMGIGEALRIIGSLGYPSKMPGTSYGLPASACVAGAKLAKIAGTVCSVCFALKDRHIWINPSKAQQRRLDSIYHPQWVGAMVVALMHVHRRPTFKIDLGVKDAKRRGIVRFRYNESGFHRWHDSGDLQNVRHLMSICKVAALTPGIKHWLPTQELGMVRRFLELGGVVPDNLVIRVSSIHIGDFRRRAWPQTSSVFTASAPSGSHVCPAPQQDHRCGSCRACWSHGIPHVAYELH